MNGLTDGDEWRLEGPTTAATTIQPMSEINVTPFVDVMLVLLIVFMVTAPLLSAGVPVDLPQASAQPLAVEKEPVTVTIDTEGRVYVGQNEVAFADLIPALDNVIDGRDERVYLRGDRAASYGTIMRIMGAINGAGFRNIGTCRTEGSR